MSGGALDIMAEMYSTFLKYALSDGAPLGKVLTPPYITSMMAKILNVNKDSRVMDETPMQKLQALIGRKFTAQKLKNPGKSRFSGVFLCSFS